jgi:hypothetical protein
MNRPGPAVLALGTLLLLASCSGDDADAKPSPAPSTSATSASPTPTEPPPTMPAQANGPFPEGAPAFAKYYVDVLNHAARTGEVERLRDLSASSCTGCANYADSFERNAAQGRYLKGDLWQMGRAVELEPVGASDIAVVTTMGTLKDDGERANERLVFVVSLSKPRQMLDLYGLND